MAVLYRHPPHRKQGRVLATSPKRLAMIKKVHVARRQLGMEEDSYRALLERVTGLNSLTLCGDAALETMIKELERLGFKSVPAKPQPGGGARADHKPARFARALWISLSLLGAVEDKKESALEAFARRQLDCTKLQWADQTQMDKLIEALKAMAKRHGWTPTGSSLGHVKAGLCDAILNKLKAAGLAPDEWNVVAAAKEIAGFYHPEDDRVPHDWESDELDQVARAFGAVLKKGMKAGGSS